MVMPDWVDRPPAVEMEMPPEKVEVPAFKDLISPEKRASPVEMLRPADEESPAEDIPPEKVEVPAPVETILPPVKRRSPADEVMPPAVASNAAAETPPV